MVGDTDPGAQVLPDSEDDLRWSFKSSIVVRVERQWL